MGNVTVAIDGMHCTGCEDRVENRLSRIDGVRSVEADHGAGQAEVRFVAGSEDAEALRQAVSDLGYEVGEIEQG